MHHRDVKVERGVVISSQWTWLINFEQQLAVCSLHKLWTTCTAEQQTNHKPTILNMKCLSMLNSRENSWEWSELALQMAFTTVILEGLHISKSL